MPYITFSRNIKDVSKLHRILKKSGPKDSLIERRGQKTVRKIVEKAASKGFRAVLIIKSMEGAAFEAQEIKIKRKQNIIDWKFSGEKKIKVSK